MSKEINPVGWFEIPTTDLARAKAFYEALFEVKLEEHEMGPSKMAWFPMTYGAPGAAGTLIEVDGHTPSEGGVLVYFTAPDLEAFAARATENGGTVLQKRTSIGEHGFFVLVKDTEGNRIGLHSNV